MLILFLSLTPGDRIPNIEWKLITVDTFAHFGMYFGLAFLQLLAFFRDRKKKSKIFLNLSDNKLYLIVILFGVSVGWSIEWIQQNFIHNRFYDLEDVVTNGIGTIFGALIYGWIGRKIV